MLVTADHLAQSALPTAVDFVQLLDEQGSRHTHPDFGFTGDDTEVADLLRRMVLARRLDQEATALQRRGELGLWAPMLGQEAAQIGSARAIHSGDEVIPSYREHAVVTTLGVDPIDLLRTFRGSTMVDWPARELHIQPYCFVIGSHTLHAVGLAMALQRDGLVGNPDPDRNGAAIVYFGDGSTSQGVVNESMVFAASYQAPVVFFCQNNQWAISEPSARQSRIPLYRRASGFGFPGVRVDGNDVLAVKAVTEWALARARSGAGPVLIEAYTYRMGPHTTADDPTKYRTADESQYWAQRDPIERVTRYLTGTGAIDEGWWAGVQAESDALADRMRQACPAIPEPDYAEMFTKVYAETPPTLLAQRQAYLDYLAGFEDAR